MSTRIARIQRKVDRGNAKAASIYGNVYDVYRLGQKTSTSGIFTATSLIAANINAEFSKLTSKADVEIESIVKSLLFTATLNTQPYQPGDLFVQRTDAYRYDRSVFTLAANRSMPHEPVFVATPINATFTRPESNPDHVDSGIVPQSVPMKAYEWPLTLGVQLLASDDIGAADTVGYADLGQITNPPLYAFQRNGVPVTVPVGMMMDRLRDMPKSDSSDGALYDDTRRQTWYVFAPLMAGQPLIPRDILTGSNGDRYELTGVQASYASFFGQLLSVQRIRS